MTWTGEIWETSCRGVRERDRGSEITGGKVSDEDTVFNFKQRKKKLIRATNESHSLALF